MGMDELIAWETGFADYGSRDTSPFHYEDLKLAWRSGWWHALAAVAMYRQAL